MPIYRRGATWHYRFMLRGVRHGATTGLEATEANRRAAEQVESEALIRAKGGRPPLQPASFTSAADSFLAWAETEHAQETARRLRVSLQSARSYFGGPTPMTHITAGHVEDYKRWRRSVGKVAEVTLRHDLHALSKLFQHARKHGWMDNDPLAGVAIPSDADARRERILSSDEERAYCTAAAAQPRSALHDVARLMLLQGLRPAEVFRLRVEHVDLDRAELRIAKSKSRAGRRTLPLLPESVAILARRIEQARDGWIFPTQRREGGPIVRLSISHERACKTSGVRCRLYDLRHTFASRMAAAGAPLATLAKILGHADLSTVMRYVHPQQDEARQALERMAAAFDQTNGRPC